MNHYLGKALVSALVICTSSVALAACPTGKSELTISLPSGGTKVICVTDKAVTQIASTPAAGGIISTKPEKIAFVSNRDGDNEIFSINVDGTAETQLTNNSAWDYFQEYSPDGSKITYSNYSGHSEIHVMNADGSNDINVSGVDGIVASKPIFSHDGTKILFSMIDYTGIRNVYSVNADGTGLASITSNITSYANIVTSTPDNKVIYETYNFNTGKIDYISMALDGSNPTLMTTSDVPLNYFPWDYSPDGTKITYGANAPGVRGSYQIFVMNADGTGKTLVTTAGGNNISPKFSADGNSIYYQEYNYYPSYTSGIMKINTDGTNKVSLTDPSIPGINFYPAVNSSRDKIAFVSTRDGNNEIYIMDADGSNQTRLTNNSAADTYPVFTP